MLLTGCKDTGDSVAPLPPELTLGSGTQSTFTEPTQNVVVYFTPPGAPLRIDAPDPGHCPF
jgi:hypothetical protein